MSFRAKLTLAFMWMSLVLVGGALYAARAAATNAARDDIRKDFARSAVQLDGLIKARLAGFEDAAAAAVSDAFFRSQIQRTVQSDADLGLEQDESGLGNATAAEDNPVAEAHGIFTSAELPLFQRYPVLAIINAEGTLLFTKGELQRYGGSVKAVPLVAASFKARTGVALWPGSNEMLRAQGLVPPDKSDELYLVMGRQIETRDGVLGVVLAGEALSDGLLRDLEALSDADVVLAVGEKAISRNLARYEGVRAELPQGALSEVMLDGDAMMATHTAISGLEEGSQIGDAFLFRSLSREIAPFTEKLGSALGLVGVVAVLVAMLVASLFALGMTRPLKALDAAVTRVRNGDLTVKVAIKSRDEIGHLAQSFNEMTEGLRQRDQIKATFKRYLAPAVVEQLLRDPDKLNLGGEDREVTVLFSDLVGFTSLSEGRKASELVALLNEYFDEVGQAIVRRGGTLDKFAGDSVMCFFGAPIDQPDHRQRALLSALDHLRVVDALQLRWARMGRPIIDCRIGLNSGPVVVGNIGSRDGQDYTVIGDAVNLASRLEGANKEYGTRLMVSEDTLQGCENVVFTRELDSLRVKGKAQPVRVLEVLGEPQDVNDAARVMVARFHEGLAAYRALRFVEAKKIFEGCLTVFPGDGPSKTFLARCEHFIVAPPEPHWDGVWKMTSK